MKFFIAHDKITSAPILFNIENVINIQDHLVVTSAAICYSVSETFDQLLDLIKKMVDY